MSDGEVNVRYEAIAEFEAALGRFAQAALERIKRAETAIRRTADQLEERRSELRNEMSRLENSISKADDEEDTSWEQRRLEEVEGEVSRIRKWQSKIEESVGRYRREAQRFEELSTGTTTEARAYLRSLLRDLSAYFAFQKDSLPGTPQFIGSSFAGSSGGSEEAEESSDLAMFRAQEGKLAIEAKAHEYQKKLSQYPELAALSEEEYLALNRYSQYDYERINPALRGNDAVDLEKCGPRIRIAIRAMQKLPAYNGPVFRGTSYGKFADSYVPGAIVTERGFTSTSKDPHLKFPGSLEYVILSRTGRDIGSCSTFGNKEAEVLFEPNARFEVLDRFEINGKTTISMREL